MNNYDLNNTRQYIRLFQMQLNGVLEDMAKPAESLSSHFSDAITHLHSIRGKISGDVKIDEEEILSMIDQLISQMFECVTSMQFVDAKRQRIEHVADGLNYLIDVDVNTDSLVNGWDHVQNNIKTQYKMDAERDIYKQYLQEINCDQDIDDMAGEKW